MNKLTCVLVDDEQHCLDILKKMLDKYFADEIEIVGAFSSPIEALKQINALKPDLLFCDVEMPRLSGIDLINTLADESTMVVFTTAHSQYALDAIKVSAIDYLVKPFSTDELVEAVKKCQRRLELKKAKSDEKINHAGSTKVSIHLSSGTIQFIDSAEIIYIESDSNYSHFVIKDKPKLVVSKTLKEFDELLTPFGFFRVHHSYLVNMAYIDHYKGGSEEALVLKNGDVVYVSRRRKQDFLDAMSRR